MRFSILLCFLVLLASPVRPGFANSGEAVQALPQTERISQTTWDPFLAGTLSWYSAGLGQIYTGDYIKGASFFLIDNILLFLTVTAMADVDIVINETLGMSLQVSLKDRRALDHNATTATFFLVSFLAFRSYNVFDAVSSAARKNLGRPTAFFRSRLRTSWSRDGLDLSLRLADF